MKNKYQRMTKEEQKKWKNRYYKTESGRAQRIRLNRLFIIGVLGCGFSLFMVIQGYLKNELSWWIWVISGVLFLFSVVYIGASFYLRGQSLNTYVVKNGHKK